MAQRWASPLIDSGKTIPRGLKRQHRSRHRLTTAEIIAVQKKVRDKRHAHADRLAETLSLDMTQWWTPSVEGFFARLPKAALVQAVAEAKVTADAPFDSVKKAEAAKLAAKALKDSGWLPQPLRALS